MNSEEVRRLFAGTKALITNNFQNLLKYNTIKEAFCCGKKRFYIEKYSNACYNKPKKAVGIMYEVAQMLNIGMVVFFIATFVSGEYFFVG